MLSYIIWNGSPEIFSIGFFSLRYYGLLFALGFLISQQIMYYIHKQEGKPEKDVDTLTIYMIVATIVGARLGTCHAVGKTTIRISAL
jgi:phosphatidylglycerol:prolipoprotein diacylglycerol transferase